MKDEHLVELNQQLELLEKKDASYVAGFMAVFNVIKKEYETNGTPLQLVLIKYMEKELINLHKIKCEHGKFNHIVK